MPDYKQLKERLRKCYVPNQGGRELLAEAANAIESLEERLAEVDNAVTKLAGPLGRAHLRADDVQDRELAEVVEQIGVIREAVEPGITAAIAALNQKGESLGERVERLEAELVEAEQAVERKRQEDGP
jgi:chromosome segregation ATPase